MLNYIVIKKENTSEVVDFADDNDIVFYKQGKISFENLAKVEYQKDISKIPLKNQTELNEKGETEFVIITKTYISLKKHKN